MPEGLEYIGDRAFSSCAELYGKLILPKSLTSLGSSAFYGCRALTGDLVIPQKIKDIPNECFMFCEGLNGTLTLHDGIRTIGECAFWHVPFKGELALPKHIVSIDYGAFESFYGSSFSHIVIPDGLETVFDGVFCRFNNVADIITLPESVEEIGIDAFQFCDKISGLRLGRNVSRIRGAAFAGCSGIGSIVCDAPVPPTVETHAFDGVPKDSFTLEVPEASVSAYQTAEGWRDFKYIAAHHELTCAPAAATALNATQKQTVQLKAEGAWSVESKPDWCTLSRTSGLGDTELTLTIGTLPHGAGDREGDVTFLLDDKEYTCTFHVTQRD